MCLLLLLVGFAGSLPARAEAASSAPNIMLFRVLPVLVDGEQWYEFHWEVTNTDRVQIFQDGKEMRGRTQLADGSIGWPPSMSGSLRTKLREVTTYELVARNRAGESATETFTVKVAGAGPATPSAPEIVAFRVSPDTVEPGGWIAFHWQVDNAQSVQLLDDFGEVEQRGGWGLTENGTSSMTLRKTTTFLLVARDRAGQTARKTFTVRVATAPAPPPTETRRCTVKGAVTSTSKFEGFDDRRQREEIKVAYLLSASDRNQLAEVGLTPGSSNKSRRYLFTGLPANRSYIVSLSRAWRTEPAEISFTCPDNRGRYDFPLGALKHVGNRLGGDRIRKGRPALPQPCALPAEACGAAHPCPVSRCLQA